MSKFSERFQVLKKESKKTQAAIAEELGMTPQTLSYYANGREPNYDTLCQIADYFHVSTDYLIGRAETRYNPDLLNVSDWQSALILHINDALNTFFLRYNAYRHTKNSTRLDQPIFIMIRNYVDVVLQANNDLLEHLDKLSEYTFDEIDDFIYEYLRHVLTIDVSKQTRTSGFFDIRNAVESHVNERIQGYGEYVQKKNEDFMKRIDREYPIWEASQPKDTDIE